MKTTSQLSLLTTLLLTAVACESARAVVLVQYGFDAVDNVLGTSAATTVASGVSSTDAANNTAGNLLGSSPLGLFSSSTIPGNHPSGTGITVGTGGTPSAGTSAGSVLSFRVNGGQTLAEATAVDLNGVPTSGGYFGFTLSGNGVNTLDLTSISFDFARGGNGNPRGVVVWYSTDNFTTSATPLGSGSENTALFPVDSQTARNVSFSLESLPETTSSTQFRFYSTNESGNTVKIDNITINGTVIPEPGALLLSSVGLLGLLRRRRPEPSRVI